MTAEIPLSRGFVALVDDEDAERVLSVGSWNPSDCDGKLYARHHYRDQFDIQRTVSMHTLLTGWSYVDHINGDGLDNRRSNLRAATHSQNSGNARRPSDNTSGFKGVSPYPRTGRWRAYIAGPRGRQRHLGYFATAEEAAHAYDAAALDQWREFAHLNFPKEISA